MFILLLKGYFLPVNYLSLTNKVIPIPIYLYIFISILSVLNSIYFI